MASSNLDKIPSQKVPKLSIIMASYNSKKHIQKAIKSVMDQSLAELELIIVDDASTDDSIKIAEAAALQDARISIIKLEKNSGPGTARNAALEQQRGDWFAIVDSDDIIDQRRFEFLIKYAELDGADIAADNILIFSDSDKQKQEIHLNVLSPVWISCIQFINQSRKLGFTKPIFRSAKFGHLRYTSNRLVAEDYNFLLRCLASGYQIRLYPEIMYYYRRYSTSTSNKKSSDYVYPEIVKVDAEFRNDFKPEGTLLDSCNERLLDIQKRLNAAVLFDEMKSGNVLSALSMALRRPQSFKYLSLPFVYRVPFRKAFIEKRYRSVVKNALEKNLLSHKYVEMIKNG